MTPELTALTRALPWSISYTDNHKFMLMFTYDPQHMDTQP